MLLADVAETWAEVADTPARLAKTDVLASMLERASPTELPIVVTYLAGDLPQGRIGIGYATLRNVDPPPAEQASLTIADVDATFTAIAATAGKGSTAAKAKLLGDLLAAATSGEQEFLRRLLSGDLRQGALEGVMIEAVARATGTSPATVRRAVMMRGELGAVAAQAAAEGAAGLVGYGLVLFRPVQPMLAQTAEDPAAALERLGEARWEWKIDGGRVQAHRQGGEVRVYTRNLKDITDRVPEVVAAALAFDAASAVLDGEIIALRPDRRPHPFQVTMRRFGRKLDLDRMQEELPLSTFWFDALHLDGADLVDLPTTDRAAALTAASPAELVIPSIVTGDPAAAQEFLDAALAAGHEGVMAKALDAPYEAGRRGSGWLKVKPVHALDLVVLAVEWGSGRRRGWLSNLHLGARDPETGGFVMLGKTFKGMTDEMLAWQTERFLELETGREGHVVYVRPEQVVEIAFDGIQASSRYPGGMALRFARVKGYRHDKGPDEADTVDTVRSIFRGGTR